MTTVKDKYQKVAYYPGCALEGNVAVRRIMAKPAQSSRQVFLQVGPAKRPGAQLPVLLDMHEFVGEQREQLRISLVLPAGGQINAVTIRVAPGPAAHVTGHAVVETNSRQIQPGKVVQQPGPEQWRQRFAPGFGHRLRHQGLLTRPGVSQRDPAGPPGPLAIPPQSGQ